MSTLHFQKDSLEDSPFGELQTSIIQVVEGQSCAFKLCSHSSMNRSSRRQSTSMNNGTDDQPAATCCFLSWVAYDRNLAGPTQITDDERLRCPIIWCRSRFDDPNQLLEHVFRCARCSDGLYWCFRCQREERFKYYQAKAPVFRKESLRVKVRRLFRSIGAKSCQKDHTAPDTSTWFKGPSSSTTHTHSGQASPFDRAEPVAIEMADDKPVRELEAEHPHYPSELSGINSIPVELDSGGTVASIAGEEHVYSRFQSAGHAIEDKESYIVSRPVQVISLLPSNCNERPSHLDIAAVIDGPLQYQSPVSPQSAGWVSNRYWNTISGSPTDTNFSGPSLSTKSSSSDVSPSSTRKNTIQSFSQSPDIQGNPSSDCPILYSTHSVANEIPHTIIEESFSCQWREGGIQTDAFRSPERLIASPLDSCHLPSTCNILQDFWKVLNIHVMESIDRLQALPKSPAVEALCSMPAVMIASKGCEAWERALKSNFPFTIVDLYALVHITYACALVIYEGQVESDLNDLYIQSLSIGMRTLSADDRRIYASVVGAIWSPPGQHIQPDSFTSADSPAQTVQTLDLQSVITKNDTLPMTQELYIEELSSTINFRSDVENDLISMLGHFLDILEGANLCREAPSLVTEKLSNGVLDEGFFLFIKENVTNPLIEGHFRPEPSLEAFISTVSEIDRLVSSGRITTISEVEVALKWVGRSTAQSMELYRLFSDRVKDLCTAASYLIGFDSVLQNESTIEGVKKLWITLKDVIFGATGSGAYREQTPYLSILQKSSSFSPVHDISQPGSAIHNSTPSQLSKSITRQVEIHRRPAVKRQRLSTSSNTLNHDSSVPPWSPTSSNTLSESLDCESLSCDHCGFQPRGKTKWHSRTIARHISTRHDPDHTRHFCNYKGCGRSYNRADNLAQHVQRVHQRDNGHLNPKIKSSA